jgi:hypothetical protein
MHRWRTQEGNECDGFVIIRGRATMRKVIILMFSVIAVGSIFVPVGPIAPQQAYAFIAPVPEPSSLILIGAGIAVLARYLHNRD